MLRRVFCCPKRARLIEDIARRHSRNGRPGSRGSRGDARPERAGPAGGNEAMSRTPMAEQTLSEFAIGGASAPQKKNSGLPRVSRGSTNAGGEGVGYFVSPGKAGSNPAFDARIVEVPLRGDATRHSADVSKEAPVLPSLTPISPFPSVSILAVVKMTVASGRAPAVFCGPEVARFKSRRLKCRSSVLQHRSFPADPITARGEDRCYFDEIMMRFLQIAS
jgi:hypothetical protein